MQPLVFLRGADGGHPQSPTLPDGLRMLLAYGTCISPSHASVRRGSVRPLGNTIKPSCYEFDAARSGFAYVSLITGWLRTPNSDFGRLFVLANDRVAHMGKVLRLAYRADRVI